MYATLLNRVHQAIDSFTEPTIDQEFSEFYTLLFSAHDKEKVLKKRNEREQLRRNLKTGAVILSVAGELFHIVQRIKK